MKLTAFKRYLWVIPVVLGCVLSEVSPGRAVDVAGCHGDIGVIRLFPESKASTVNTETWSSTRVNTVRSEILNACQWWSDKAAAAGVGLTFTLGTYYPADLPIDYEPITMSSDDERDWINDCMDETGYSSIFLTYMQEVQSMNDSHRTSWGMDYVYSIFVVDSLNDGDGKFSNNEFAYAYLGGPFVVTTYDNDGWGINNFDHITAHETGHICRAYDEYASSGCSCAQSYNGYTNQNCENCNPVVSCIMRQDGATYPIGPSVNICYWTKGMVGWSPAAVDTVLDGRYTADGQVALVVASTRRDVTRWQVVRRIGDGIDWNVIASGKGPLTDHIHVFDSSSAAGFRNVYVLKVIAGEEELMSEPFMVFVPEKPK